MARRITGTNGADRIVQGLQTDLTVDAKGGNDTIILNRSDDLGGDNFVKAGTGNDAVVNRFEGGNLIRLDQGNDTYVGTGFAFSGSAADLVRAGGGNDTIAVSTFHSRYFGESGNDSFFSEGWQNVFNGGSGRDTISYLPRDDSSTLSGSGVTVDLGRGQAQTGANRFETLTGFENATGSGAGDRLIGSNQDNVLDGGAGDDGLSGLNGRDVLIGGRGTDAMLGGAGGDRFVFASHLDSTPGEARDGIGDFNAAEGDVVDLRGIDADLGRAGDQGFTFIGATAFTGRAGELLAGEGLIAGDIDGDGFADFEIAINQATMSASDFLV